jgi:hypothetical protein
MPVVRPISKTAIDSGRGIRVGSGQGRRESDELRSEYDFSKGVRGKHHEAYEAGTNVVLLDADVAKAFPDSPSINKALRMLLEIRDTEKAKSLGAQVKRDVTEVPGMGWFSIIVDPTGAPLGLWQTA